MLSTNPITQAVHASRARRLARGLKRYELFAHPEDWAAIKAYAKELQRLREAGPARDAG